MYRTKLKNKQTCASVQIFMDVIVLHTMMKYDKFSTNRSLEITLSLQKKKKKKNEKNILKTYINAGLFNF